MAYYLGKLIEVFNKIIMILFNKIKCFCLGFNLENALKYVILVIFSVGFYESVVVQLCT